MLSFLYYYPKRLKKSCFKILMKRQRRKQPSMQSCVSHGTIISLTFVDATMKCQQSCLLCRRLKMTVKRTTALSISTFYAVTICVHAISMVGHADMKPHTPAISWLKQLSSPLSGVSCWVCPCYKLNLTDGSCVCLCVFSWGASGASNRKATIGVSLSVWIVSCQAVCMPHVPDITIELAQLRASHFSDLKHTLNLFFLKLAAFG